MTAIAIALQIFLLIGTLALVWIVAAKVGYRLGEKDARAAGYEAGRKDADNWWIGVEREADQARRQIWKEEAQL